MQCPQCNNGLRTVTHRGVEIETCSICHGIWFDSHEVLRYLNRLVHDPDSQNYFKKVNSPHKPVTEAGFCPKCNQILEFDYIGESALHFQKCVNCSGIWLDRRNLKPLALWYASASSMEQITLFGTMKEQSFDIKKGSISKGLLNLYVDENPVRNFPWATLLLVLVNTMIFLVSLAFKEAATAFYLVPNEL